MSEKIVNVSNGIKISYIENRYNDNQYRVNVFKPSELNSTHIGAGNMGSSKNGVLTLKSAQKILTKLQEEYDFSNYNFSESDEKELLHFVKDDIETVFD